MKKILIKITIILVALFFLYISPKGQNLEIKDKSGITYKAVFHKGTLVYVIFADEENLSKGIVLFVWRWDVENIKVIEQSNK